MPKKIAIIGGSGFIGTALVKYLRTHEPTWDVMIFDIAPSQAYPDLFHSLDVCDEAAVIKALAGYDMIYHLAAEHRDDVRPVQKYYDVNVGGAKHIVAAAEKHGIKHIIFTSTVAVYGLNAGESKETDTPQPFNDYGESKWQSEGIFNAWADADPSRTLTTLRLVATFGPGNRGNIYTLIDQIARRRFVMIGNGHNKKSIAYVGNVAAFLGACLHKSDGERAVYNYADKPDLSMNEMITTVSNALASKRLPLRLPYYMGLMAGSSFDVLASMTRRNFPISKIRVQKFAAQTIVNADKAHAVFQAPYSLADGLKEMIKVDFC